MKSKQGVILLETILSIALFFIILSITTNLLFKLQEKSKRIASRSINLLSLEATKQFLHNNKNFDKLIYSDNALFFDGNLLLKNVSTYSINLNPTIVTIDICIDENTVCSKWKIKN